uniref:Uncharacterized protein n=1 Tax=Physcomitrium patens TaxID=3218 RepID=A0A2K1L9H0_PHYPA|nr:hypothetical protein PHYPA_001111 [Physcomitrium patens]
MQMLMWNADTQIPSCCVAAYHSTPNVRNCACENKYQARHGQISIRHCSCRTRQFQTGFSETTEATLQQ